MFVLRAAVALRASFEPHAAAPPPSKAMALDALTSPAATAADPSMPPSSKFSHVIFSHDYMLRMLFEG